MTTSINGPAASVEPIWPFRAGMTAQVRIYVVTYRRPHLLERALKSLLAQTDPSWIAEVLNDDPHDGRVATLIDGIADPRITLSRPAMHRGGTGNFNFAFRKAGKSFAAILEDDNWWEPDFLATMRAALEANPDISLACANERVWREQADGAWLDTGTTIWPVSGETRRFGWNVLDKCGSAKLCNSAMMFRTAASDGWQTPVTIPIDVTEHFRERAVPHPILLVMSPLVNYGDTRLTHRSKAREVWASYQILLIGSVFALMPPLDRAAFADTLWRRAREQKPPLSATLLATGVFIREAWQLWRRAPLAARVGFCIRALLRPGTMLALSHVRERHGAEWTWLQQGAFAEFVAKTGRFSDA